MPHRMSNGAAPERFARRAFLARLGAGGAALVPALAPGTTSGGEPHPAQARWRLKLSTSTIQFSSLSIEDACRRIAALGFTGVDIWSAYQGCPHLDDCLDRLGGEGLVRLLQQTGLELTAFSTYVGGFAKYARLLGKMGGGVAIQGSAAPCEPAELTSRMRRFFEELKPLADLATETNSILAIENHGHALLDSLDSIKAFTDLNPSPRLGLALAPYHLQAIDASIPEAIRLSGTQLKFFYAWQNAPGRGQLPGLGPADFTPWLRALADIAYGGYVNPFMHDHPEPAPMTEALQQAKAYLEARHASDG